MGCAKEACKTGGAEGKIKIDFGITADNYGFSPMVIFYFSKLFCVPIQGLFPILPGFKRGLEIFSKSRSSDSIGMIEALNKGLSSGAESPSADRMIVIPVDIHNAPVIQISDQAASYGTFPADGFYPLVKFFSGAR